MKPILSNKQVERILSLIVIFYGLGTAISNIELLLQLLGGWNFRSENMPVFLCLLSQIAFCGFVVVFFPRIVQGIGYFATEGKPRSKRQWFDVEIVAVPLILFAFIEFVYVLFCIASIATYAGSSDVWWVLLGWFPILLFYTAFAVTILMNARSIAAWLLRRSDAYQPQA